MRTHSHAALDESVWVHGAAITDFPPLVENITCDVCVVGGGIAGLSTAYLLTRKGKRVVLLDNGRIGGGQTQVTSAHLSSVIDDRFVNLERWHGAEGARLAAASHRAAIDQIGAIVSDEHISCEFERLDGYLFAPPESASEELDREFDAASRTGIFDIERLLHAPWPTFNTGPCLRFSSQAQFHPLKYLAGLAEAIVAAGGRICCHTHVDRIAADDFAATITTSDSREVTARNVVVATNSPINDTFAIHTKQAPYISYVIGLRMPAGLIPRGLYWDLADPYHYVRLERDAADPDHELLIVGGEDHKTGQAHDGEERFERLEAWARERFPFLHDVEYRWSGQVMETVDGLAFIGRNPRDKPNVFVATGDSGMGLTHGTIAGMLISELIVTGTHPWEALYDPARKPIRALGEFAKENLNVAAQYTDWLTPGEVDSPEEVLPGRGAIMRRGMNKIAVYRDQQGVLTELSAVCPHLKCIVQFNDVDRTWDCPCHGSRFDACGHVLNGPANADLPRVEED